MAEERKQSGEHSIILQNKERLHISGVKDVESFDDNSVVLVTLGGNMVVRGNKLHIDHFNVESGELMLDGEIYALVYTGDTSGKGGLLRRVLK